MLRRPLYRGVLTWGRTQTHVRGGTKGQHVRDASEWLRREVPALAIVPAELAAAVASGISTPISENEHGIGNAQGLLNAIAHDAEMRP